LRDQALIEDLIRKGHQQPLTVAVLTQRAS
jgi:hypothetical protein